MAVFAGAIWSELPGMPGSADGEERHALLPVDRGGAEEPEQRLPPTIADNPARSGTRSADSQGGAPGAEYAPPPPLAPGFGSAAAVAPSGWQVETQASGDLNGDGRADLAFILVGGQAPQERDQASSSPDWEAGAPRILGVAFARSRGGYRLVLENRRFLPARRPPDGMSQGWMLFEDGSLEVRDGGLRIAFEYARSRTTFTLRWQDNAFRLIGYDSVGVAGGCMESISANFLTRRARIATRWIDRGGERSLSRTIPRLPLITLDALGEGEAFYPDHVHRALNLDCPERS